MGLADAVRIELIPLKNKTDQLIDGVDDILENLKAVFEADATLGLPTAFESIQRTVESLEQTSLKLDAMVAENRSTLKSIFSNVDEITANLKNHNDDLANVMENFSDISDTLAASNLPKSAPIPRSPTSTKSPARSTTAKARWVNWSTATPCTTD